ncbi:MAG TPA: hypothetical protein GXZ23_00270 [Clostridiales bacterium]|nr:hypothetical protein [Clostridiales bacterium]
MVDLLGAYIKHTSFGVGKVVDLTDTKIKIEFPVGTKMFAFPDAFEEFWQCEDKNTQSKVLEMLTPQKRRKAELNGKKQEQEQEEQAHSIREQTVKKPSLKILENSESNVAFKCNYCDGGITENGIGYLSVCTDEMICYNIEQKQHNQCISYEAPCRQYYEGEISRKELDEIYKENFEAICYESQMLKWWVAGAGWKKANYGQPKPKRIMKAKVDKLAILTTILPSASEKNILEKDRIIFGVFLVDKVDQGDGISKEGYVTTSSKYKLSLTRDEAKKVLFWNYYYNKNSPEKIGWVTGLFRYITDIQAASILKDIVTVKKGKQDEELAQEFLEYFCEINQIDISELPIREGALQRRRKY